MAFRIKSKGMPGVTANNTGTPGSKQKSRPIAKKRKAVRRVA